MTVSEIEIIKTLKAVKATASDAVWMKVVEAFKDEHPFLANEEALERRLTGLCEEDEFAVLCQLMGTCTELVQLEGRPLSGGDPSTPDFLAEFRPGCRIAGRDAGEHSGFRCLVDVKTTDKKKWRLSGQALDRLRNFSSRLGLPLVIAVRFKGLEPPWWQFIKDTGDGPIKVTASDLNPGLRHVLWDEFSVHLSPYLTVEHEYCTKTPLEGIHHPAHGTLTNMRFRLANGQEVCPVPELLCTVSAVMDVFGLQESAQQKADPQTITHSSPTRDVLFLSQIVRGLNGLTVDAMGMQSFNASKAIALSDQSTGQFVFNAETVATILEHLIKLNVISLGTFGPTKNDHYDHWLHTGGRADSRCVRKGATKQAVNAICRFLSRSPWSPLRVLRQGRRTGEETE